ncbi:hypothetical protein L1049_002861 [Liquidambar formosana]|uniref:non-specific serine/threonine protein kinase n=1 Tax=Liquidambar formosana TaxID=63359 RepID=A0AAP0R975_LIQFO
MGSSSVIKWHHLHKPFFLLFCVLSLIKIDVVLAVDSDQSVLLQFKNSVSDSSGLLSRWNSDDPNHCSWFGVSCDSNSRVLSVNISGGGGGGSGSGSGSGGGGGGGGNSKPCSKLTQFPLYGFGIRRNCVGGDGKLVGTLPPAIAKLTELRVLSLPYNELSGEIPDEVWGMEKLEILDLEGNSVTGSLPFRFEGLRNLRVLNLGFNRIVGEVPTSLSNCVGLEILNLAGNQVNGTIPGFIGGLSELRGIYLSYNRLGGSVPSEIGMNCKKLEHLDLSGNFLVKGIPSSLGNCSQLRTLLLYSNLLEEVIPSELGRLRMLEVLDVSWNSLSGSIPPELGNCTELSVLVLSNLFNPLPTINGKKGYSSVGPMSSTNDDYNYFEGSIPVEITTLPKLRIIWAPRATLEGRFPSNWGACDSLEMINLAQNFFSGEIPEGFVRCPKLHFLDLSSNRLTGTVVETLPVPCMTVFDVSGNLLSGPIPRFSDSTCPPVPSVNGYPFDLDDPSSVYLSFLTYRNQVGNLLPLYGGSDGLAVFHNFGGNNFTGTFQTAPISPERLGKQTVYAFLAGENKLTGPFPGSLFAKCDGLSAMIVNVSNNRVSGQIPAEIDTMCRSLKLLDASGNQINGSLPHDFGDWVSLVALNLSWNLLQGQIPTSISQIKGLKYLSLDGNNLTGSIPSSLGMLRSLEVLELSSNSISGEIPKELANLGNLTVLLLNNNNLSGQIPSGLANVTSISTFNASFNNLSGPLPLSNNLMKCNSVLGNPFLQSCRMISLTAPSSDPQGRIGDSQNYSASPSGSATQRGGSFNSIEIAAITSASAIVSVLLALIVLFFYTRRWNPKSRILGSTRKEVTVFTDIGVPLTFENVVRATGSFNASNCIGSGGFGATYKAEISPGFVVAIKRLAVGRFQGIQQFHAELKTLGRFRHPNLVTLIGYHASETEMFLIYNYLSGGLWDAGPHDDLVEVLHLAVVCTVDSLSTRPTMKQVVRRLKQLQPPSC